ncbi:MAG: hypothetical protein ABIU63_15170 [Chitinophagaceae bacterium]
MNSCTTYWGLLGTDGIGFLRRSRTLEIGSVVRKFNNLAVPGMGNVRFGKQIYLAALGLAVAEKARTEKQKVKNIEMANAIEAIACLLSFQHSNWKKDPRLKGSNKLKGVTDLSFSKVRKPGFYITQPMRMGTVQALPALGLVNADIIRFNSFQLTAEGRMLVNQISGQYPKIYRHYNIVDFLALWTKNSNLIGGFKHNDTLRLLLSPLEKLAPANRNLLKNFIYNQNNADSAGRCKAMLTWMDMDYLQNRGHLSWSTKPSCIDDAHWKDLKAGACFFKVRSMALGLLDELEKNISRKNAGAVGLKQATQHMKSKQTELSKAAQAFLQSEYDPSPERQATVFCSECMDIDNCIRTLVERDGVGLKLKGEMVIPGPGFKGTVLADKDQFDDDGDISFEEHKIKLPDCISTRVYNMFYLNQDLKGTINKWL